MKFPDFSYARPTTIPEAIEILSGNDDARPLAGGQSLLPMMALRMASPGLLVDLGLIEELAVIAEDGTTLRIGAMVTHDTIARSEAVARRAPLLREALHHVAHQAVRNRGTIGGSLANADGSAEMPVVAVALDAVMTLQGPDGVRRVRADEFFQGHYTTAIGEGELLTCIDFPDSAKSWVFEEVARRPGDFALAMVAAGLQIVNGRCLNSSLVIGGVSDRPIRSEAAAAVLDGRTLDRAVATEAAQIALDGVRVRSDIHADARFRTELAKNLVVRALLRAGGAND
nr:L451 [uncultured bacterium]